MQSTTRHYRQQSNSSNQARAKSVNAQKSNYTRKSHNKSENSQPPSTSNKRSISHNKQFQFTGQYSIDPSIVHHANQFASLNNTTSHIQQQQLQALLASQQLHNSSSLENGYSYAKRSNQQFSNILNYQRPIIQTPTALNQHSNGRRSKHSKAYSMVQSTKSGQGIPYATNNSIPLYTLSQSKIGLTEQFLNQPLQLNQRILNQTIQYGNQNFPQGSTQFTPLNYSTITPGGHLNESDFLNNYFSQQATTTNKHRNQMMIQNQSKRGFSPKSLTNFNLLKNQSSSNYNHQQQPHMYNPFLNYKQNGGVSKSSSRISAAKLKNNTISHIRSFSNCSKRDLSSKRSGLSYKQSSTIQPNGNKASNNISEAQLLESEEYFEQGKVFLSDKKYKEAVKAFSKSLQYNKQNFDALFYKGVTHLDQGLPDKAITDLNELIDTCPDYRKTVFIVLSIAYRRINDYTGALRTLSKAIVKYPKYIEAYIARGQIYIFQKKWDKALTDFRVVISLQQDNGLGYLGQGDSLKGIGNYNGALQSYTQAIEVDDQCISQGLMKRGLLYLQMKFSEQAFEDFNKLCELAELQESRSSISLSKAYFYKAKALKKINNHNDAILHFEQVIRLSNDQFLQSSALYEIAKIKIQQKDFYEAYYNLQRATHYKLKQKKLINYKIFTEGVIFLMKRKTKTGLKLLSGLLDKLSTQSQQNQSDYITPLIYIYRAYGFFVNNEYDKSLKDYIKSNQIKKLNTSANYNMIMCQGLKSLEKKEYENAISFFTKASQKIPGNRDPYFLRAVSIVQYAFHKPIKPQTKNKMLRDAKRDLNRALKHSPKDYQVLYFRGILNFALHYFYDAIIDFETVIEKSEETSAKFYLARGRCYACLSMFKEAITDLSIAINLNKDLLDAYLNRGKCAYLIGDTGLAFMDFQKLIVLEPKNPMVHIYAGNLLMTTGSYEDATKAFTNADNIHKSPLALYQRSRCHVALNNMNESLKDLSKVIEISPNDKVAIADKECLTALKQASTTPQQTNLQLHDRSIYEKSANILTKLISYEKNQHLARINHDSSIMHQHSQIIPSAQRTKIDKIRALKRRKEQDRLVSRYQAQGDGSIRNNDLRFRVANQDDDIDDEYENLSEIDEEELEKINRRKELEDASQFTESEKINDQDEELNYYKENIFNKEDYYLYRAVMFFYSGEYEKSIQDFEQSSSIMHATKVLYPRNQYHDEESSMNDDNVSNASSQTDLSDVGLCSLNIHEYSFNTVLNLLQMKEFQKALKKLDYIIDTIPKKYASQIWIIRYVLNQILGHTQQAKKDLKRAYKHDNENTVRFIDQKQNVQLNVFPQQQRLCNFFSYAKFQFPGFNACIYMKPSFSFPFIKPPNMIPCVDNSVLEQFTIKAIPLKPEAPWIKKCSFGIKFTEQIYFTDDDREPTPDEEKEYKKRKQQQRATRANAFIKSYSERVILKNNIFLNDNEQNKEGGGNVDQELQQIEDDNKDYYNEVDDDIDEEYEDDNDKDGNSEDESERTGKQRMDIEELKESIRSKQQRK